MTGWRSMLAALTLVPAQAASPAPTPTAPRPPTVADPRRGLELWRGARIGMTAGQVRALFPNAQPPADPAQLTDGEVERLELAGVTLADWPASAQFYFRDNELISIKLAARALTSGAPGPGLAAGAAAAEALKRQYGSGYDCADHSAADIDAYECKWLRATVSIRYWYMDVAGQAPLAYLAFRQADDPGYDL